MLERNQRDFMNLYVHGRHCNISPVYLSQSLFATPKVIRIRQNCSTAPTLPPTPQLLIFHRLTQDNTFPSFPRIPSLPFPNPPQIDMSLECQKCDKLFITQADYDAHPCNQATSSSSGQRVQSSQNNAVPDDPVAKAEREVEKLCEQIDKIESLAHEKYRRSEPGFLKNAVTCVVSYNGNEQEWTEAFAHLVKLKDRLKV